MPKANALSTKILEKKYYGPEDKSPEDVFKRVARVVAVPDVLESLITHLIEHKGDIENLTNLIPEEILRVFPSNLRELVERIVKRRGLNLAKELVNDIDEFRENVLTIMQGETEKYYEAISNLDFMPASPTLMNAGLGGMLSSCFFIRVEDSMSGIFDAIKEVSLISKVGGGVGLDFSGLRYTGCPVKTTSGTSSGPISFMRVFNTTGETVRQGGRRKAAMLAALRIDHPDIVNFITCKTVEKELSNFNISVLVTDEFMKSLELEDADLRLHKTFWDGEVFCIRKEDKSIVKKSEVEKPEDFYSIKDIWDLIIKQAWMNGEPGIVFDDVVNKEDVFSGKLGRLGLNPCSELNLLDYESCNLGSINLSNCVKETTFDYEKLERLVRLGVRFLDNVVDLNNYPLPKIEEMTLRTRKIGLGTMGLHDVMLKLGITYGSQESLELIDSLCGRIKDWAFDESVKLGKERGVPKDLKELNIHRRNAGLLTCPPTGTVSMICNQVSSGIEPVYGWEYKRDDSYGKHHIKHFMLDTFQKDSLPEYAKTALEIPVEDHVKVQARVQKYIDSSISKTVNMPNKATRQDVEAVYRDAYKLGCKSVTVYREGSRKQEVLSIKDKDLAEQTGEIDNISPRERPQLLFGVTIKSPSPSGPIYVTINEDDFGTREVFINASKSGSDVATHTAAEGRLISNSLQYRVPVKSIIRHLKGQRSSPVWDRGRIIQSLPDAVARCIELFEDNLIGFSEYLPDSFYDIDNIKEGENEEPEISGELCPECGNTLVNESGCNACKLCGYSSCG